MQSPLRRLRSRPLFRLELNLELNASRQIQGGQSLDGSLVRVDDVDQTLVSAALELLAGVLVLVNCAQDGYDLLLGRQRDRAGNLSAVALSGLDDLLCGLVDQLVIIRLQANADFLCVCPCGISSSYVCHTLK